MTSSAETKDYSKVRIVKITSPEELDKAQKIRYEVFVLGQNVPAEEEIDQFEEEAFHFLAYYENIPCGAARWRFTEKGVKLERFAVLEEFRGKGVGSALVRAVLNDVSAHPDATGKKIYLHSQLSAMRLYDKFGFRKAGGLFRECDIDHYKMEL